MFVQGTLYFVEPSACERGQILVVTVDCGPLPPKPEGGCQDRACMGGSAGWLGASKNCGAAWGAAAATHSRPAVLGVPALPAHSSLHGSHPLSPTGDVAANAQPDRPRGWSRGNGATAGNSKAGATAVGAPAPAPSEPVSAASLTETEVPAPAPAAGA